MAAGDHLEVPRQHGLFNHHGIEIEGKRIAHYIEGEKIISSSLDAFSRGEQYKIIRYQKSSPINITVNRAKLRIGEQKYNLLFNNCEHFASWCKIGIHHSQQIEDFLKKYQEPFKKLNLLVVESFIDKLNKMLATNVNNIRSKRKIRFYINKLNVYRNHLQQKLDSVLSELDLKRNSNCESSLKKFEKLISYAKIIANTLTSLEELEIRIQSLLND